MRAFASDKTEKIINPVDIFKKKLVHQSGYDFLRDNQTDFLKQWHGIRQQRDIVGLMDTGSGKTLIGLLMLYSKCQEGDGPAVYLCPDNQLVDQVCVQASLYGIPVCQIEKNENGKQEFPLEYSNSESVLVTTFERLFNGRSIFGVNGHNSREIQKIGALLIDDAHECVKKAREKSTIKISRYEQSDLYDKILKIFEESISYQGIGALASIKRKESSVIKQVPFWSWKDNVSTIHALLESHNNQENKNIFFNFNLISNNLEYCECYISGNFIEITPTIIPTENIPSFYSAEHRFILSATLGNNNELVRELGIDTEAVRNPITVDNVNMGERLILSPKRMHRDITDEEIRDLCSEYSNSVNVAVIVPNERIASYWVEKGAKLIQTENIILDLKGLKEKNKDNFVVFLNRYDGIDLVDDMCRILVIDGMPTKESLKDKIEIPYRKDSIFVNMKKAQSIEQGLGRAVRSGTDHCVSILMGNDLLNFIGINNNKKLFSSTIQSQLDFGVNLTEGTSLTKKQALNIIKESIEVCLKAEDEWRQFHKSMINDAQEDYKKLDFTDMIELAGYERKAIQASIRKQTQEIVQNMNNITLFTDKTSDEGWSFQLYAQLINEVDSTRAQDLQLKAFDCNNALLKPLTFVKAKKVKRCSNQLAGFKLRLNDYERGTDIILKVDTILSHLVYSPDMDHKKFENSIKELGLFLGFESTQPDMGTNDGPDNFWRMQNNDLVIECKNNSINSVSRDETNQMSSSVRWYGELYAEEMRLNAVMLHRSSYLENNAHGEFKVIDETKLNILKANLRNFAIELSIKSPNTWLDQELEEILNKYYFSESALLQHYFVDVKRS